MTTQVEGATTQCLQTEPWSAKYAHPSSHSPCTPGNNHRIAFCAWYKACSPRNRLSPSLFYSSSNATRGLTISMLKEISLQNLGVTEQTLSITELTLKHMFNCFTQVNLRLHLGLFLLAMQMLTFLRGLRLGNKLKASQQFPSEGRILTLWSQLNAPDTVQFQSLSISQSTLQSTLAVSTTGR